ncbi:MAG: hypothetical protein GX937_08180 [Lentisphaerae bacterium]|jgi:hypothetical protein|nr:hypothetical protein [Lentisphaerota bacterium]
MNANYSSRRFGAIVIFALLVAVTLPTLAAPRLTTVSLKQGNSQLKFSRAAARLAWGVENPDAEPVTVTLQIKPDSGHGDAIYARQLTIPAQTVVEGSFLVVINDTTRFHVELLQNKVRIAKDDILVRGTVTRRLNIAVLDDDTPSLGTSEIIKNKELDRTVTFTTIRQVNLPDHWAEYQNFDLLVLLRPDLSSYSPAQMIALRDYVMQGGYALLATPAVALQIGDTMLHDFLSATPVAETRLPDLDLLCRSYGVKPPPPQPDRDADGFPSLKPRPDFLVMTPLAGTASVINTDGRPVFNLRRIGCGTVAMLAFDPFQVGNADHRLIAPVWNAILRHSNFQTTIVGPDLPGKINQTLQLLQGYSIPPVSVIVQIFFLYVLVGIAILGVAFHFRRHALGWLLLCVYGAVITALVFVRSNNISTNQARHAITTISTSVWDCEPGPTHATSLLFSRSDCRPTLVADSNQTFFQAQPPGPYFRDIGALAPSPWWITTDNQEARLERFALQQNRPRTLVWRHTRDGYGATPAARPVLAILPDGRSRLHPWALPKALAGASRAALIFPDSHRVINLANATVTDSGEVGKVEADTVFTSVLDYATSLRLQHPCLVLTTTHRQASDSPVKVIPEQGNEPFTAYNYDITFVPVDIDSSQARALGSEFFSCHIPDKSFFRSYYRYGKWENIIIQGMTATDYTIDFQVVAEVFPSACQRLAVSVEAVVPGNHTTFDVNLETVDGHILTPLERHGSTYVFDTAGQKVFSPQEQRFRAIIKATTAMLQNSPSLPTSRTLFWRVAKLSASANYSSPSPDKTNRP